MSGERTPLGMTGPESLISGTTGDVGLTSVFSLIAGISSDRGGEEGREEEGVEWRMGTTLGAEFFRRKDFVFVNVETTLRKEGEDA